MTAYTVGPRGESRPTVDHSTDPLVTALDVAAHLAVTPETVRLRAAAGDIPAVRVGRLWRFDLAAVKAALSPSNDPWAQSAQSAKARRK